MASVSKACWKVDPEPLRVADGRLVAVVVVEPPPAVVLLPPVLVFFDELHPATTTAPSVATAATASRRLRRGAYVFIQVLRGSRDIGARHADHLLYAHGRERQ
jgi:hypothetical protein